MVNVEVGIILFLLSMSFSILLHCSVYIVVHHHPLSNRFSHLCVVLRFPIWLVNDQLKAKLDAIWPMSCKIDSKGLMGKCKAVVHWIRVEQSERSRGYQNTDVLWEVRKGRPLCSRGKKAHLHWKQCEVGNLSAYNSSINSSKVQMQSGHWCTKVENPDQTRLCHSIHTSSSEP
jgi:hypothetical protein